MKTNKKLGNDFETELCNILFENGFWCHNMAQNQAGQPADIIAAKNGNAYLIDCKVCSGGSFALSRVEENQRLAMGLWQQCGNGGGFFALQLNGDVFMINHLIIQSACSSQSILSEANIQKIGIPIYLWLSLCG